MKKCFITRVQVFSRRSLHASGYGTLHWLKNKGYSRIVFLVNFFVCFFEIIFCFVVDICDLVHDLEAIFHIPLLLTASGNLFLNMSDAVKLQIADAVCSSFKPCRSIIYTSCSTSHIATTSQTIIKNKKKIHHLNHSTLYPLKK